MPSQRSANAFSDRTCAQVSMRILAAFAFGDLVEAVDELASAVAHERLGVGELVP